MELDVAIERHEQRLNTLERDMGAMKDVQNEIRTMNESLVTLANEMRHTNEHLARHERRIDEIDAMPGLRLQQTVTAVVSALAGGLISMIISLIIS